MSFLDKTGLEHFWAQCLNRFAHKETVANLSTLVGTTAVATQISDAIDNITFPVISVNNKAGAVSLNASDVGALPASTVIPDALADLTSDTTHRTVTDAEKATWNAKSDFSGNYNDLTNKPTIPSISGLATETYVDNKVATEIGGKVSKSGDTMTGWLTAPRFIIKSGDGYPALTYQDAEENQISAIHTAESSHRVYIAQKAIDTSYTENYHLPALATNLTENKSYQILTTKGDYTMGGSLTAPIFTIRRGNSDYPTLYFHSSSGVLANSIQSSASNGKLYVVAYPSDASGYHETYMFPTPSTGLTANKDYSVLTTKAAVTIAQGGTGATTKQDACWNLIYGVIIQPPGIEFLPGSTTAYHGGHIDFHYNNDTSVDYTSRIIENANGVVDINGVTASNGTLTATKVIGAVYA